MTIKYSLKDISVIIPTYNRSEDLKITLLSFKSYFSKLNEIIIIDQSINKETSNVVHNFKSKKLKYFYSKIPSLTHARNMGVSKLSKSSKIVCFLDDDVDILPNFFESALSVFNKKEQAKGCSVFIQPPYLSLSKRIENRIKRFFFIES